jgi:chitinase
VLLTAPELLEHHLVELGVSEQALEAIVLLLMLIETFGLGGLHADVELLSAVVRGSRYLQGSA